MGLLHLNAQVGLVDNSSPRCLARQSFRTSDWDKPNCRAIRAGVTPALKAARTAFSCPRGNRPYPRPATRSGRLGGRRRSAPPPRLSECHREQAVEFLVIKVVDAFGRSLGRRCRRSCAGKIGGDGSPDDAVGRDLVP